MSNFALGNSDFLSDQRTGVAKEVSRLLRQIAGQQRSVKEAIRYAANYTKFTFSRTRSLWYEDARVRAEEADTIRHAARKAEIERERISLLALRNRLATIDFEFHRPTIEAIDRSITALGNH